MKTKNTGAAKNRRNACVSTNIVYKLRTVVNPKKTKTSEIIKKSIICTRTFAELGCGLCKIILANTVVMCYYKCKLSKGAIQLVDVVWRFFYSISLLYIPIYIG